MNKGIFLLFFPLCSMAQEWQWSVPVNGGRDHASARAWLWIPPDCKKVRAVVVAQNNMEELSILENAGFRHALSDLGLAEVWVSPAFDHTFNFTEGAGEVFTRMMQDLADSSGYTELGYSPVIPIGHSAAASWPYYFAAWDPGRTVACISVSGQWPYFRHPAFAPDIWRSEQNIDFIPLLETMGEYEAAATWSEEGLKERSAHPFMALSMLACPGEGHFAATQKKIDYIAFYLRKALHYRLPNYDPLKGPPVLRRIDPTTSGWLMDKWRGDEAPVAAAAPVGRYKGDTAAAFWFFDEEMVRATERYEAAYRHQKAPLLGFSQQGVIVRQRDTHLQVSLRWLPETDGVSFVLKGVYLDTVPGESPRPSVWTGLPAGAPVGHPAEAGAIRIDRVIGPVKKINDTLFRLDLQKEVQTAGGRCVLTFVATSAGDGEYKPAVQQAEMVIPVVDAECEGLRADLPVFSYVEEGPAEIKDSVLHLTRLPPRSRYPVKVTVVSWQYGKAVEGMAGTVRSVKRTFFISAGRGRARHD